MKKIAVASYVGLILSILNTKYALHLGTFLRIQLMQVSKIFVPVLSTFSSFRFSSSRSANDTDSLETSSAFSANMVQLSLCDFLLFC